MLPDRQIGIMPYASRTGTRRNLAALREHGFALLISATGCHRDEGFETIGLDNGAWTAFQSGQSWDEVSFLELVEEFGHKAQWVVVPDVVADRDQTLESTERWLPRLRGVARRRLVAVQDGMTPEDVQHWISPDVGIFVGGSTDFKWATLETWAELARERGAYLHVGRVNTIRGISRCTCVGADSFDGTSATMFSVNARKLGRFARQGALQWRS